MNTTFRAFFGQSSDRTQVAERELNRKALEDNAFSNFEYEFLLLRSVDALMLDAVLLGWMNKLVVFMFVARITEG